MEKYLFLDIDGVLNSDEYYTELYKHKQGKISENYRFYDDVDAEVGYKENLDRAAVELVNWICNATGAKVILSSSWRVDERSVGELAKLGLTVCGKTPMSLARHRGREIKKFLDEHPFDSYCILDDDTDILEEEKDNFVLVDYHFGLTSFDSEKAIKILGKL